MTIFRKLGLITASILPNAAAPILPKSGKMATIRHTCNHLLQMKAVAMPSITIRIDDDMADQIDQLAEAMDRTRSWIAGTALKRYLQDEKRWLDDVRAGMAEMDRTEGIPHDDVMNEMRHKIDKHHANAKR